MRRRHVRFEIQLVALSVLLLLSLGGALSLLAFAQLELTTRSATASTFAATTRSIEGDLIGGRRLLESALRVTSRSTLATARTFDERKHHVATLIEVLGASQAIAAAYIGYANGTYLYVRATTPIDHARPGAVYLVRDLDRSAGTLQAQRYYLDSGLRASQAIPDAGDPVDPRVRPWFIAAGPELALGDPYHFGSSHETGFTASLRGKAGVVAAASVGLLSLSTVLEHDTPTPGAMIALVDGHGRVFALSDRQRLRTSLERVRDGLPTVESIAVPQLTAVLATDRPGHAHDLGSLHVSGIGTVRYRIDANPSVLGADRRLVITIPERELSTAYGAIRNNTIAFSVAVLLIGVIVAQWIGRSIARPLVRMAQAASALEQLDFSEHAIPASGVREIDALAATFGAMRTRLLQFTELSAALAEGQDLRAILDRTLAEIVASIGAEAGVAYIAQATGELAPIVARGLPQTPSGIPPAGGLALHAANVREPIQLQADACDPTLGDAFASLGTGVQLRVLALPFVSHGGDLVALVLAARRHEPAQLFPESAVAYGRSFAGSTALALEAQRYLDDLERFNQSASCFVPSAFLAQLECSDISAVQLGHYRRRRMAVFSSDIRSFTTISEELGVERTFEFLTAYLSRVGPCVRDAGGFIDRYVGDAIVALFPQSASDAVRAAVCLQREVRAFNASRPPWLAREVAAGVGIDAGEFVLGTIGEAERYATAAISPAVARAETIESRTPFFGAPILMSEEAARETGDDFFLRAMPLTAPDDGEAPLRVFEVVDIHGDVLQAAKRATAADFAEAVASFDRGRFAQAAALFRAIADASPGDLPAARMRDHSRRLADLRPLASASG